MTLSDVIKKARHNAIINSGGLVDAAYFCDNNKIARNDSDE